MVDVNRNQVAGELFPEYCPSLDRIIVHVDFDEYGVQVAGLQNPQVRQWIEQDLPIIVATVHSKRIVAINYRARRLLGIKRSKENTRSVEQLVNEYGHLGLKIHYPETRYGREDTFTPEKYMNQIIKVLDSYRRTLRNKTSIIIERVGLEEFYVDVTKLVNQRAGMRNGLNIPFESRLSLLCDSIKNHPNQNYNGYPIALMETEDKRISKEEIRASVFRFHEHQNANDMKLIHGACIASAILRVIFSRTKLQASAGVGHTKELARRACLSNKPEGVTIFSFSALPRLSKLLKIEDIHGYGSGLATRLDVEYRNHYGDGRLSTFEDVQKLGEEAVDVLQGLFEEVEYPERKTPQVKAKELVRLCYGNDGKNVQESLDKKGMETTEYIPEGLHPDEFKDKLKNLARDFADRIKFLKDMRGLTPKNVRMQIMARSNAQVPLQIMRENCPGWLYMFNYMLNRIRDLDQLEREDVQQIKLIAIYI